MPYNPRLGSYNAQTGQSTDSGPATGMSTADWYSQWMQQMQGNGATGSTQVPQLQLDYSPTGIASQRMGGGVRVGGGVQPANQQGGVIISQPQTEDSNVQAQRVANMINQMVGLAQAGGYGVPMPAEGMPVEDYMTALSTLDSLRRQMAVDRRATEAQGVVQDSYGRQMADPLLAQARSMAANDQGGVDWDLYETMRQSYEAQNNRNAVGGNVASRGVAGSSAGQLAGNQARSQYAGKIAQLYPTALKATDDLRNSMLQRIMQPLYATQGIEQGMTSNLLDILRSFSGSPEFVLSA